MNNLPYLIEKLNLIKNNKLIKITDNCIFGYLEEDLNLEFPVKYYFKVYDLSINSSINLKWGLYGYYFFKSILETLDDPDYCDPDILCESLNNDLEIIKKKKVLLMDDVDVGEFENFEKEILNEYNTEFYTENSIIHFKLKININEFICLQNVIFPKLFFTS